VIPENASFEEAVIAFQTFLEKCERSQRIAWVGSEDVLLTGKRFMYVRTPIAQSQAAKARETYEQGLKQGRGVRLETLCELNGITCCHVWVPQDEVDAAQSMMGKALHLSVRTDRIIGKPVQGDLRWRWLRWRYGPKQEQKKWIFSQTHP
jgi:hypothetical protein